MPTDLPISGLPVAMTLTGSELLPIDQGGITKSVALSLASSYILGSFTGSSSIAIVGTITAGAWQGSQIADSYIASASNWNSKQSALSGTGIVKSTAGSISYINGASTSFVKGDGSLDSTSYLINNQTITLSGDVSGSGANSITTSIGAGKVTNSMLFGGIDLTSKVTGLLPDANIASASNWNSKQNALAFGNLIEATSSILTITGGTGAIIGSGLSIQVAQSSGTQSGYLSSTDWTTFNNKQNALSGTGFVKASGTTISYDNSTYLTGNQTITLTGNITGSGSTSIATTIANNVVTNAMLVGNIAASKLVGTDIATVGTITSGTWNATILSPIYGGTGVNNGSFTNTLSGNFATTGAFNLTFSVPMSTTWTLPNTANETLAGLGTAQSYTAKQTFTGSDTQMASVSLLDTTYKTALDISAANTLRLGNGFTSVNIASGGGNTVTFTSNNFTYNGGSSYTFTLGSGINKIKLGNTSGTNLTFDAIGGGVSSGTCFVFNGASAFTYNAADTNLVAINPTYQVSALSSNFVGLNLVPSCNMNGTAAGTFTNININPTITNLVSTATLYGLRSQIAYSSGQNRWNIFSDGTASNYFAGNTGIGTSTLGSSFLTLAACTTSKVQINFVGGTAPTSPNNGDLWYDGTHLYFQTGGSTHTII